MNRSISADLAVVEDQVPKCFTCWDSKKSTTLGGAVKNCPSCVIDVKAMLLGTGTKKRQETLATAGSEYSFNMKRSGDRYLVYVNQKWIGEMPVVAAKKLAEIETSGRELVVKDLLIMKVPAVMADIRKAAFELFDRHDCSDEKAMLYGVMVVVEAG